MTAIEWKTSASKAGTSCYFGKSHNYQLFDNEKLYTTTFMCITDKRDDHSYLFINVKDKDHAERILRAMEGWEPSDQLTPAQK